MPRFSLKRLLVSTTLVAIGLSVAIAFARYAITSLEPGQGEPNKSILLAIWFGSGALVGAGLLNPFKLWLVGIAVGLFVQGTLLALWVQGVSALNGL